MFLRSHRVLPGKSAPNTCLTVSCPAARRSSLRHFPNQSEGGYTLLAVGFAGGPAADAVSALEPEEALQRAVAQLDDMFGGREWLEGGGCTGVGEWDDGLARSAEYGLKGDAFGTQPQPATDGFFPAGPNMLPSQSYVNGVVQDWTAEPFIRGGYCYPKAGFDEYTHADAASVVDGRLFFAGEHTNVSTGMTVHAALDAGER